MFVILVFFFRYQVLLCSSQTPNEWVASQEEEEGKKADKIRCYQWKCSSEAAVDGASVIRRESR